MARDEESVVEQALNYDTVRDQNVERLRQKLRREFIL